MTERFVLVDWAVSLRDETVIAAYERDGHRLKMLQSRRIQGASVQDIALFAAEMCQRFSCPPLIETVGAGAVIEGEMLGILGSWPSDRVEPKRIRQL